MKTGTIYALRDPWSDEIRYIGQTTMKLSDRMRAHRYQAQRREHGVHGWWRSLAPAHPTPLVLEDGLPANELNDAEKRHIAAARDAGAHLLNLTHGGGGRAGSGQSPSTRERIGAAFRGKCLSAEHVAKMSARLKGHPVSAEAREKMAAAKRGKKQSPEHVAARFRTRREPQPRACECGMVTHPGAPGRHLQATGHRVAA